MNILYVAHYYPPFAVGGVEDHTRYLAREMVLAGHSVRVFHGGASQSRLVKSGSSYLSQSELPVTFGVGRRDRIDRVVITWPNGKIEEHRNLAVGKGYECVEGKGIQALGGY